MLSAEMLRVIREPSSSVSFTEWEKEKEHISAHFQTIHIVRIYNYTDSKQERKLRSKVTCVHHVLRLVTQLDW